MMKPSSMKMAGLDPVLEKEPQMGPSQSSLRAQCYGNRPLSGVLTDLRKSLKQGVRTLCIEDESPGPAGCCVSPGSLWATQKPCPDPQNLAFVSARSPDDGCASRLRDPGIDSPQGWKSGGTPSLGLSVPQVRRSPRGPTHPTRQLGEG